MKVETKCGLIELYSDEINFHSVPNPQA